MAFVGVTPAAHKAALERLYSDINPSKVPQVPLMWDKFGEGVWAALTKKYPEMDIASFTPRSLAPEAFAGTMEADHTAALTKFYNDVNPGKLSQIPLAWRKFNTGVWKALAAKYPNLDLNKYAPVPSGAPAAAPVGGNPFAAPAVPPPPVPAAAPAPAPTPAPAAPAAGTGNPFAPAAAAPASPVTPISTPAAASAAPSLAPEVFAGVSRETHAEGLRQFYSGVNPSRIAQIDLMLQKFGDKIWQALAAKYPDKDVARFAPIPGAASGLAPDMSSLDSPRRQGSLDDVFGAPAVPAPSPAPAPAPAPAPPAKPMPKAAALFGDSPAQPAASELFAAGDDDTGTGASAAAAVGSRNMFAAAGEDGDDHDTAAAAGSGEGQFAAALLSSEGSGSATLFGGDAEPAAASEEVSSLIREETVDAATIAKLEEVAITDAAPAPAPAPVAAAAPAPAAAVEPEEVVATTHDKVDYDALFNTEPESATPDAAAALFGDDSEPASMFGGGGGSALEEAAAASDLFQGVDSPAVAADGDADATDVQSYIAAQHPNAEAASGDAAAADGASVLFG